MRESKIERDLCKYAKNLGWYTYKWVCPGNNGVPDRIFIKKGKILFIEFKSPGKKLRDLQRNVLETLKNEGCNCYIIDDICKGRHLIDEYTYEI